jgi:hypothetical protein
VVCVKGFQGRILKNPFPTGRRDRSARTFISSTAELDKEFEHG